MAKRRFLIAGSGGREGAFALALSNDSRVHAVMDHANPLIIRCVKNSGGSYMIGNASDPETVLEFAQKNHRMDYAFINSDQPLANGVVDRLLERGIKTIGATRAAARIEWDKVYSMDMMNRVCRRFTPFYRIVRRQDQVVAAVAEFERKGMGIAVKPQGLTGGKGVKIMPEHLQTYDDSIEYATNLLETRHGEGVLLVERLDGIEFTIMGITDGEHLVIPPASYDYPFRHEGDRGAGTGGMGCFTNSEKRLPFMSEQDLDDCRQIMQRIIDEMRKAGSRFNGVINGGFFKTQAGIKFMEFNGRFGDPEGLNILSILETSFSDLLVHIWNGTLSDKAVSFAKKASVVKYLVAKEYPEKSPEPVTFDMDEKAISDLGVKIFFASCERLKSGTYTTLGRSRVVAFSATADSIEQAAERVNRAIDNHTVGNLEYRHDIGSRENLEKLNQTVREWRSA